MRAWPIDNRSLEAVFIQCIPHEYDDAQTKDRDGTPQWDVALLVKDGRGIDAVTCRITAAKAPDFPAYSHVDLINPSLRSWSMDGGRAGVTLSAESIVARQSQNHAPTAPKAAAA